MRSSRALAAAAAFFTVVAGFGTGSEATATSTPADASSYGPHLLTGFAVAHFPEADRYSLDMTLDGKDVNGWPIQARAHTDDVGSYAFEVPDGIYTLHAHPDPNEEGLLGVVGEYYLDAYTKEEATRIVVSGGDQRLADIELEPVPELEGRVVDESGDPVPGMAVGATAFQGIHTFLDGDTFLTDVNGRYALPLWAGQYAVHAGDPAKRMAPEWYADAAAAEDATPLQMSDGRSGPTIVVGPGGSIAGVVTDSDGNPARKIRIGLTRGDLTRWWDGLVTDMDGRYRFTGLAAGTYHLAFDGWSHRAVDYASTELDRQLGPDEAATVDVVLERTQRPPAIGPSLVGRLIDSRGRPVSGVHVSAEAADRESTTTAPEAEDWTDPEGVYRLSFTSDRVAPGERVTIEFEDEAFVDDGYDNLPRADGTYDYVGRFYGGAGTSESAERVTVTPTVQVLADTTLTQMGGIAGQALLADGTAPDQIVVGAWDAARNLVRRASVATDGTYFLDRLPPGDYKIWFGSGRDLDDRGYPPLPNWWSTGDSYDDATPVSVSPGQTVAGISQTYEPFGRPVTGRIVDPQGRGLQGVRLEIWSACCAGDFHRRTRTDTTGRFDLGLRPGTYKMSIGSSSEQRFQRTWYGGGSAHHTAGSFTVQPREPVVDLGPIRLSTHEVITGRVTGSTGQPLARVSVVPYRTDGTVVEEARTITVGNGAYRVVLADPGEYRIGFDTGDPSTSRYFRDALALADATPVSVASEAIVSGVDQALPIGPPPAPGPQPTEPTPAPVPDLRSCVVSANARHAPTRDERGARIVVRVKVTSEGSTAPPGHVTVREGKRVRGVLRTHQGRATLRLRRVAPGLHKYLVRYRGPVDMSSCSHRTTVRVRGSG